MKHFHEYTEMSDGVRLYTDIVLPDGEGPFNAVVIRSPYGSGDPEKVDPYTAGFVDSGLAFVINECRGTGKSEGQADLWRQEADDGRDFFKWLEKQTWFGSRAAMNGESYPGSCQWQAARSLPHSLGAITPHNAPLDIYKCAYRPGGAYALSIGGSWAFNMLAQRRGTPMKHTWNEARNILPLSSIDSFLGFQKWDLWQTWMKHPEYDSFWQKHNAFGAISSMTVPAYITGGWFDLFLNDTLEAFRLMRSSAAGYAARKFTRCVIEPYDHNMALSKEADYGKNTACGIIDKRNTFIKNILADPEHDPLPEEPAMRYFMMGSNEWRETEIWPPQNTVNTSFYLCGNGSLAKDKPSTEAAFDQFVYDPEKPVPTRGGNDLACFPGQYRQDEIEKRPDVLLFTGMPLDKDTDVTGYVKAVIYASTDCVSTDFTAKLCDVSPEGVSLSVCCGIIRSVTGKTTPDVPCKYEIDMSPTAITFKRGHRVRLQISSSDFPRWDRNTNTDSETETRPAHQKIWRGGIYPSHLVMPLNV